MYLCRGWGRDDHFVCCCFFFFFIIIFLCSVARCLFIWVFKWTKNKMDCSVFSMACVYACGFACNSTLMVTKVWMRPKYSDTEKKRHTHIHTVYQLFDFHIVISYLSWIVEGNGIETPATIKKMNHRIIISFLLFSYFFLFFFSCLVFYFMHRHQSTVHFWWW